MSLFSKLLMIYGRILVQMALKTALYESIS
jgi:hypothetical protein